MKQFSDRVAAITGAGSGIGQALAHRLAAQGAHLALSDIDEVGMAATAERCEASGIRVTTRHLDVADRSAVHAWADEVVADHAKVNAIFNNAGVSVSATVEELTYDDFDWLMNINFWGVVHGTKAFLPHLEASGEGHIVNISSVFGLMAIPSQSAYNAAKFGVRGFTDSLRMELEIANSCVSATTIHPGGIKTNIVRNSRLSGPSTIDEAAAEFERLARTTPDKAADQILAAVARNRRRALIGPDALVFDGLSRLPAAVYQRILVATAKRQAAKKPAKPTLVSK